MQFVSFDTEGVSSAGEVLASSDTIASARLVIGVASGGLAFAEGLAADLAVPCLALTCRRSVTESSGSSGAKDLVRSLLPDRAARWYRTVAFPVVSRLGGALGNAERHVEVPTATALALGALHPGDTVVIVDDSADSGATLRSVRAAVAALAPGVEIVAGSVTATTGPGLDETDYCLLYPCIADRHEQSDSRYRADRDGGMVAPVRVAVDLDGTLLRVNSFRPALRALVSVLLAEAMLAELLRLVVVGGARRLRGDRAGMKARIEQAALALPEPALERVRARVVEACVPTARRELVRYCRSVDAPVLTAACGFYAADLVDALGLDLAASSGFGPDGRWVELSPEAKAGWVRDHDPICVYLTDDERERSIGLEAIVVDDVDVDGFSAAMAARDLVPVVAA